MGSGVKGMVGERRGRDGQREIFLDSREHRYFFSLSLRYNSAYPGLTVSKARKLTGGLQEQDM
jgi:hypothetical protein